MRRRDVSEEHSGHSPSDSLNMQTPSESYSEPHTVGFSTRGMQMNTGPTMDKNNGDFV